MGSNKRRYWTWSDATWSSSKDYGDAMNQHGLCCVECHAMGTTQGENTGAAVEQERIIRLLKDTFGTLGIQRQVGSYVFATDLETLIKGEQK
jgi:hypothetical protein